MIYLGMKKVNNYVADNDNNNEDNEEVCMEK